MAYGEFYVERQGWARWPRVLVMCRKRGRDESGNIVAERRRYVPVGGTQHKLEAALERACEFAAESTGSCPLDVFDIQPRPCEAECRVDMHYAECWRRWFEREESR
jgi:hypothetical protein